MNGKTILVGLGGTAASNIIGGCKSCELSYNGEVIEISSATSQTAREFIGGRTTWKVTLSYLVASLTGIRNIGGSSLASILNVGNTYTLYFGERSGNGIGSTYVSGSAILTGVHIVSATDTLVKGTIEFQGTGPLT